MESVISMVAYCRSSVRRAALVSCDGSRRGSLQRDRRGPVRGSRRVSAVQALQPRLTVEPSADVVTSARDGGDAIALHVAQALRHPQDRAVLGLKLLVVALRALGDQHRLHKVRRIDDGELRVRRHTDESDDDDDQTRRLTMTHLRCDVSADRNGDHSGRSRSLVM